MKPNQTNTTNYHYLLPLFLLFGCYPLGIAAQNIFLLISISLLLIKIKNNTESRFGDILKKFKLPIIFSSGLLIWMTLSTFINPANEMKPAIRVLVGLIPWIILPPMIYLAYGKIEKKSLKPLFQFAIWVCFIWSLLVLSQYFFGWRIKGIEFVKDVPRPRGLYSHPLTLAYAASFTWPIAISNLFKEPKKVTSWLFIFSSGMILYLTQSRTIQAIAAILLIWNILHLKGKWRLGAIFSIVLLATAIGTTNNPISTKFTNTFSKIGEDRKSDYADDRLLFWHAHSLIIKERPILGHGANLTTKYRTPYYEQLGYADFTKKYEAHNMFIQIVANAGIVGLILFLCWIFWYLRFVFKSVKDNYERSYILQVFLIFLLGGITQNAFQDSEVRYGLTLFTSVLWLIYSPIKKEES